MPFTLAHPVAVLPLARCRYAYLPALVLGSIAPDLPYFLGGRAAFGWGHSLLGAVYLVPLCAILYGFYVKFWREALRDYLPCCINPFTPTFRLPEWWIWLCSLFFGIATHDFLDAFTHETGYFVNHLPFLREYFLGLPVFKWLQYSGGVLGLAACGWFMWRFRVAQNGRVSKQQKWHFWAKCGALALIGLGLWQWLAPVALGNLATAVIRAVDCAVVAFSLLTIKWRFQAV
ncbi:DUF4184 family protein [Kingella negevensis]|uniref:Uncharacterized protein n=1 Tax=Kingella negevensis TaxID=1522312 RepID=A0A238TAJ9_9NEIS|nr:DUF4184 family protein [Kingella negevensis]MDK4696450.1 DUF4184 family protein [Kingella negevensis]WII93208.1 DUF4184 family protein [Kingella negevensis]SNB64151.1 Uncharacterised protein [Kingella negevensis]